MMNRKAVAPLLWGLFTFVGLRAQNQPTTMDSLSYSLGVLMAKNLQQQGVDSLDWASVSRGLQDVFEGKSLQISANEANQIVQDHMRARQARQYEKNIQAGQQFLAENAKRPEVVKLPSGLQYEIMKKGEGPLPKATDKVTVHYHGALIDGTVFDSSVDRGQPATFGVTQVIQGWVEALQLMPLGSKWRLFIPYDLGYGERGAGPKIGPYSTLIFDVELLKIN